MQALSKYIVDKESKVDNEKFLDDLAFSINERRSVFPWKAAVVGDTIAGLAVSLSENVKARSAVRRPTLGFVFTGQGAQWAEMGKELLLTYPVFKRSVLEIDKFLKDIGAPFTVQGTVTPTSQP
jgi:acyl transferase domain-containing protein